MSSGAIRIDVNVQKEGEVFKLAGFFIKTWESRWFRLRGRQLLYYKTKNDDLPKQTLSLRGAKAFRAAEGKVDAKTEFCVEIQLVEPAYKSYYFCTPDEDSLQEWISAINEAAAYKVQEICKLKGHDEPIISYAFSPDGKQLLTATASGVLKAWDMKLYKLFSSVEAHRDRITQCGYFNQGQRVFTVSLDKSMKIWDRNTFQLLRTVQGFEDGIVDCIVIPDNRHIVTATFGGSIKMWNSNSFQVVGTLNGHRSCITSMSVSNDGKKFVTTSEDGTVICWSLPKIISVTAIRHPYATVHGSISKDGNRFVLWDKENSVLVYSWEESVESKFDMSKHRKKITKCFFTPNSSRVVTASEDQSILIWDASVSGQLLSELTEQMSGVTDCMVSNNQQLLLSVMDSSALIWDFQSMDPIYTCEHDQKILLASFIPDFSGIVCMKEDGVIQVWSL